MGLNLYLATHLIRQLGGEVSKRSNIISFTLPCNCGEEKAPTGQDETSHQGQYEHMRVLIADDSATCRKVLRQQCHLLGIPVIEAGDGLEALAMIRNETYLNRAFDIIILDHHMPGLKGLQVAERINGDPGIDPHAGHHHVDRGQQPTQQVPVQQAGYQLNSHQAGYPFYGTKSLDQGS